MAFIHTQAVKILSKFLATYFSGTPKSEGAIFSGLKIKFDENVIYRVICKSQKWLFKFGKSECDNR